MKKNQNVDRGQSVVIVIKDRFLPNAPSAKVDEYAQWFNTPLPGRLSDVFGLKVNGFYETPEGCELSGRAATRGGPCCVFGRHWYLHAGATKCDRLINE